MKNLKLNEQDLAVIKLLTDNNIKFDVYRTQELKKVNGWDCDEYRVVFTGPIYCFETYYRCGVGHRVLLSVSKPKDTSTHKNLILAERKSIKRTPKDNSFLVREYTIAPSAASVLHSLILDSDCGDYTFDDFCDNLGYDNDSRSAMDLYLQCQKTGKELKKVFSRDLIVQLQEILQDY